MEDLTICDRCEDCLESVDLIWLTSEDFQPLPEDNFNKKKFMEAIDQYDALCYPCYKRECCD